MNTSHGRYNSSKQGRLRPSKHLDLDRKHRRRHLRYRHHWHCVRSMHVLPAHQAPQAPSSLPSSSLLSQPFTPGGASIFGRGWSSCHARLCAHGPEQQCCLHGVRNDPWSDSNPFTLCIDDEWRGQPGLLRKHRIYGNEPNTRIPGSTDWSSSPILHRDDAHDPPSSHSPIS